MTLEFRPYFTLPGEVSATSYSQGPLSPKSITAKVRVNVSVRIRVSETNLLQKSLLEITAQCISVGLELLLGLGFGPWL